VPKAKVINKESISNDTPLYKYRLALFINDYKVSLSYGHQTTGRSIKNYPRGTYTLDQDFIDKLINDNAPIEVFYSGISFTS
jgi:hypothetical protein